MSPQQYVYGVVRSDHPARLGGVTGVGEPALPVRLVAEEQVAAVVSLAPPGLRAKRRDLLGHQRVVAALHEQGPVLPMRFGIVADSEESLRAELREASARHLAALDAVVGRVEFNAKLEPDEDALVREIADVDPAVRRLRRPNPSYSDQVRLGEAVAAAVERRELTDRDQVLAALSPLAVATADGPPVKGFPLNTSFLVEAEQADGFRSGVERVNRDLWPGAVLRCTGPLPPYSFATAGAG
ncbi:MAG: GvpL/GvpF family gas vesicle protein [Actinocatenispora sp.]